MRKQNWSMHVACMVAGLAGPAAVQGQYEQAWQEGMNTTANLDDVGTDVAADSNGNSYIVGWVRNSSTKTSYRLRIYHADGSTHSTELTRTWGPQDGVNKAYAVAIEELFENLQDSSILTGVYIYITGETASSGGAEGQNIGTIRYYYDAEEDEISTETGQNPAIQIYNNEAEDGDDIGLDIGIVGDASAKVVVTGWSEGESDVDSITIGCDPTDYFTNKNSPYYRERRYSDDGDDVTVHVTPGPAVENIPSLYVSGYTQPDGDYDYLLLNLDVTDGTINQSWAYGTAADERACAAVAGKDENGGIRNDVYVTGWTDAVALPIGHGEDFIPNSPPNFLTIRWDMGETDWTWARLFNGTGNDADIAYDIAWLRYTEDTASENEEEWKFYPEAVVVGGASTGDGTELDFRAVGYDPADGTIINDTDCDWTDPSAGVYAAAGPDELFRMAHDWMPGHIYGTGRTWIDDFDFATARFLRGSGELDDDANGIHSFPVFTYGGSADDDDSANAIAVGGGGIDRRNPDVFVTGYTVDTGTNENIRTIKYYDPDDDQ